MVVKMAGTLEMIIGSMFSGKTEELQRRLKRAKIARIPTQVFKPTIDNRWGETEHIVSHNGEKHPAIPIPAEDPKQILEKLNPETKVVAIDEAQFFKKKEEGEEIVDIVDITRELIKRNLRVIITGLPTDFRDEPFGQIPILMALAEHVDILTAICDFEKPDGKICGQPATKTQRLVEGKPADYNDPIVLVGAKELYAARCREHHFVPGKPGVLYQAPK